MSLAKGVDMSIKKKISIFMLSLASAARLASSTPVDSEFPHGKAAEPVAIRYDIEADAEPTSRPDTAIRSEETVEPLGFVALQRRLWDRLAPVRAGLVNRIWRILAWLLASLLAVFFVMVWPLPQIFSRAKDKFAAYVKNPSFSRLAFIAKVLAFCLCLLAYFLVPAERRIYLGIAAAACFILLIVAWVYFARRRKSASQALAETE